MTPRRGKSHACTDIEGKDHADHEIPRIRLALLGVCLLAPAACAPPGDVPRPQAQIPALAPGMAWVWLPRDNDPEESFGTPIIYANGQPIARGEPGAASYRDLPPGT